MSDIQEPELTLEQEISLLKLTADYVRTIQHGEVRPQLLQVLQDIKTSAEQGFSSIDLEETPHPRLHEELVQRGFSILFYSLEESSQKIMKISW